MRNLRVDELIERLGLEPHPEGGFFREIFRSQLLVHPDDDRDKRNALTTIYFLLVAGEASRWHRVRSDEVWHYYEGDPVDLYWIDEKGSVHRHVLGRVEDGQSPCEVIPAGRWQAARTRGAYTLVGCTVGPGFEFEDFEMREGATEEGDGFPEIGK